MSEDEKKTLTREELCELFRQAEKEYSDQTYGEIPPLDKSFMNAKKSDDKSSKRRRYSLIATAAALMICIVTAVHPMIGNDAAYGDKGILHRLFGSDMGIGTDEQDGTDQERECKVEIDDLKNIEEAKDLCRDLYVPEYLPEGFELKSLVVEKSGTGTVFADYTFKKLEKEVIIGMCFMEGNNTAYSSNSQGEMIRLDDRTIVPVEGKAIVEVYTEDGTMMISGDVIQEEMIRIAKGLTKA